MTKANSYQSIEGSNPVVVLQFLQADNDPLPAVPVMPETLLLLDLVAQEPTVDLRGMSQLVLDDMGATLQILRLAGREYGNSPTHAAAHRRLHLRPWCHDLPGCGI